MFGRYRGGVYESLAADDVDPFSEVRALLTGDLTVVNLETPVTAQLPAKQSRPRPLFFGASPSSLRWLRLAGIGAVSLANNHAADLGTPGLRETPLALARAGVFGLSAARSSKSPTVGRNGFRPTPDLITVESISIGSWKIGFIAVTSVLNFESPKAAPRVPYLPVADLPLVLAPKLEAARADNDLLVLLLHWGTEYAPLPSNQQRRAAHALVEAGADLIIGHHPHVLQPVERVGEALVAYSLGNFLFDSVSRESRLSSVLGLEVERESCSATLSISPVELMRTSRGLLPASASAASAKLIKSRLRPPSAWVSQPAKLASWRKKQLAVSSGKPFAFGCRDSARKTTL